MCSKTGTGRRFFQGSPCEVGTPGLHRRPASHWVQETVVGFAEAAQNENLNLVLDSSPTCQNP